MATSVATLAARTAPQTPATVDELLARSGTYLVEYEKRFSAVVSEEVYIQRAEGSATSRVTRADVLVLNLAGNEWIGFRDVFDVDGAPIRDHDQRLQRLFLEPSSGLLARATELSVESARFNVGLIWRNVNVPTMALTFLRQQNQARSAFKRGGDERLNGVLASTLDFTEKTKPTIIRSRDVDQPASGRFWIEPDSGRILKSELKVTADRVHATIDVMYGAAPKIDMLVPVQMNERYNTSGENITALAVYSNFRRFLVDATAVIK